MNSVTDTLISPKFTSKMIENTIKMHAAIIALDEAPAYVTGHRILPKNSAQKISGQFVNKPRHFSYQKNLLN